MASEQDFAEQLLRRADEDAAGAKGMLPIDEVADVLVCFHAQQAVEKALKAVLAANRVEFAHRHDLRVLIGQCENAGLRLPEELVEVDLLSPYAAELRYDDDTVHAVERETERPEAVPEVFEGCVVGHVGPLMTPATLP